MTSLLQFEEHKGNEQAVEQQDQTGSTPKGTCFGTILWWSSAPRGAGFHSLCALRSWYDIICFSLLFAAPELLSGSVLIARPYRRCKELNLRARPTHPEG